MNGNFATKYLLTIILGYFSETFSKSLTSDRENIIEYLDILTLVWKNYESLNSINTTVLNKVLSESKNLRQIKSDQVSEDKSSWKIEKAQGNQEQIENFTIKRNVAQNDKFQSKLSPIGDYIFGSLVLASCILSLLGNGCVLTTLRFRQRRLIPIEVFFINLALTNILISVASYPLSIISSFKHGWNFGEIGCTFYGFWCYFLSLSSIYTITAMAFTRYLITCKPIEGDHITCRTSCKMVATGYVFALFWATLSLLGFGNYQVEPFGLSCSLDWIAKDIVSRIYIVLVTIFCVFLPLIILIFCYTQIIILVKRSNEVVKNTRADQRNWVKSTYQLTWTCGLISTGFVIGWFPYTIACLSASFQGEVVLPIWLTPGPALFAKSSIVYNPIIYIFLTARYRQDVYDLVQYISHKSGLRKRGRKRNPKKQTGRNGDGSTFHCGTHSICTERIPIEISICYIPATMKETCV